MIKIRLIKVKNIENEEIIMTMTMTKIIITFPQTKTTSRFLVKMGEIE